MDFLGHDDDINIQTEYPEFCMWRWGEIDELEALVVPFKRALYHSVMDAFAHYLY